MSNRKVIPPFDIDAIQPPVTERQRQVITLLQEGHRVSSVAATLGCSPETVKADRNRVLRSLHLQDVWSYGLSTRVLNCCNNLNITSKEGLEELMLSGNWRRVRNFGNASMREVAAWLGWDPLTPKPTESAIALERKALKLELAEAISVIEYLTVLGLRQCGYVTFEEIREHTKHLTKFRELPSDVRQLVIEVRDKRFGLR